MIVKKNIFGILLIISNILFAQEKVPLTHVVFHPKNDFFVAQLYDDSLQHYIFQKGNLSAALTFKRPFVILRERNGVYEEILGLPQDSIVIGVTDSSSIYIHDDSHGGLVINRFINYMNTENHRTKMRNQSINLLEYFKIADQDFEQNRQCIQKISTKDQHYKEALNYLNQLRYYIYTVAQIPFELKAKHVNLYQNKNDALQAFVRRSDIVMDLNYSLFINQLPNYNIIKKGLALNFVNYVNEMISFGIPHLQLYMAANNVAYQGQNDRLTKDYQDAVTILKTYAKDHDLMHVISKIKNLDYKQQRIQEISRSVMIEDTYGKSMDLQKLIYQSDKPYVLIDCWASWCGPCIDDLPIINDMKEIFGKKIQFIHLSLDKKRESWLNNSKDIHLNKSSYWIKSSDLNMFSNFFQINSIPRYILVAKDGRIINAQVVSPQRGQLKKYLLDYLQ